MSYELLSDAYAFSMMRGYFKTGIANKRVCFEYFFRKLPIGWDYIITCGLDNFLEYIENFNMQEVEDYINTIHKWDYHIKLDKLKLEIKAIPEGTPVFHNEPIIRVVGELWACQLVETTLLNMLNYSSLVATKASRICKAAKGKPVLEFGLRRAHGLGGIEGSRAAYIGGCVATSNVYAGKKYGIPVAGTHAHSWIMSFPTELEAFRAWAKEYPENCTLLVDTYNTLESGVPNAIIVYKENTGIRPCKIRLDSGNLVELSIAAKQMFKDANLDVTIVATDDLDEYKIAKLEAEGAQIDVYGVGTNLITVSDSPSLGGVYKLVAAEEDGKWVGKSKNASSADKATMPGIKEVIRIYDGQTPVQDTVFTGNKYPSSNIHYLLQNSVRVDIFDARSNCIFNLLNSEYKNYKVIMEG